jgi:putative DNA primase/helicase
LARLIQQSDHFALDPGHRLYVYRDGVYGATGQRHIEQRVKALLQQRPDLWTSRLAGEVAAYIAADAPELEERPRRDLLNVANGLLEFSTRRLLAHDPAYLTSVQLPVSYDPVATCPNTERFIRDVFPADAVQAGVAWQIAADLVRPDRSRQKSILCTGEGANGKSTYLAALLAFLGRHNVASVSLHRLEADRFSAARLVGKLANICPDLPSEHLAGTSVFKAVTGGDPITAEYKFRDGFDFVPFCRLVFSANHLPQSKDGSHAFFRRWLVIPFDHAFD